MHYLRGEELDADVEKGWILITVNGLSLGWGKASQGRIKNHYPKGLRLTNTQK
jgi:NOL1/NOP2/fmu family ribosome biogenesis protein